MWGQPRVGAVVGWMGGKSCRGRVRAQSQAACGTWGIASARGGLLPCPGMLASLSAPDPAAELQGFALQHLLLAPLFPLRPALTGFSGDGGGKAVLTDGGCWWVFRMGGGRRSALPCRPGHCALAVCLWHPGSCWRGAVPTPGRWLQAGDVCS